MRVVIPQIAWHARDPVLTLDFDPRGKTEQGYYRLASGGADNLLLIWHISKPESTHPEIICVSELNRHQKAINVCRFSPCGKYIASGDDDAHIFIWKNEAIAEKEETWTVEKVLRRHVEDVADLSWSPDSNYLISGSVDNTAVLWDVKKGIFLHFWSEKEHTGFVQGVAYDPLGEFSASMCIDRNLRFFNNKSGKLVCRALKYPPAWLGTIDVDEDEAKENKPEDKQEPEPEPIKSNEQPHNEELDISKDLPLPEGESKDEVKLPPKKPNTTLNRLFHDDTLKTFCRRLSYSPRGELLIVPGGLLPPVEKKKEVSRQSTPVDDEDSKEKPPKRIDADQNNAVVIFCRNSWTNPCAVIPTGVSYSIAARFSPVYYDRLRQPYEYAADFINSNRKCDRMISCVGKLRPPQEGRPLLDMPYRLVYAVATNDSILIGDTASAEPLACIQNIHCTRMTDISWSSDGLVMVASSTDGYCSILTFDQGELGREFKVDEFPTLTPTCFPIAPPEPKPVKKKEPKEPKPPKEPKEKKEKKVKAKNPTSPDKDKEVPAKKHKTIMKLIANMKPNSPSQKSPVTAIGINNDKIAPDALPSSPQPPTPVANVSSPTPPAAATTTPKPTFLDAWVKKTPKSSTSEAKTPRRIQLTTLSATSNPVANSSSVNGASTNSVIKPGDSSPAHGSVNQVNQPRRILLTTLAPEIVPTAEIVAQKIVSNPHNHTNKAKTTSPGSVTTVKPPRRVQLITLTQSKVATNDAVVDSNRNVPSAPPAESIQETLKPQETEVITIDDDSNSKPDETAVQ